MNITCSLILHSFNLSFENLFNEKLFFPNYFFVFLFDSSITKQIGTSKIYR